MNQEIIQNNLKVVDDGIVINIFRGKECVRLSQKHKISVHDIVDFFDYYFNSVEPEIVDGYKLVDFSQKKLQKVRDFDLHEIKFPAFAEPVSTTKKYMYFADLKEDSVVLDLGAYSGLTSILFDMEISKNNKNAKGKVIAVEADLYNKECIEANLKLYKEKTGRDIEFLFGAVWNEDGEIAFSNEENMSSAVVNVVGDKRAFVSKIQSYKLSTIAKKYNLKKVDFIKCDIEGAESVVFQDAEFFAKYNPKIIIGDHKVDNFTVPASIYFIKDLLKWGYKDVETIQDIDSLLFAFSPLRKGRTYKVLVILKNIFSITNEGNHKVVKILGIKMKFKKKQGLKLMVSELFSKPITKKSKQIEEFKKTVLNSPLYRVFCDNLSNKTIVLICNLEIMNKAKTFVKQFSNLEIKKIYLTGQPQDYPKQIEFEFADKKSTVQVLPLSQMDSSEHNNFFAFFENSIGDTFSMIEELRYNGISTFSYYCELPDIMLLRSGDENFLKDNIEALTMSYNLLKNTHSKETFVGRTKSIVSGDAGYLKSSLDSEYYNTYVQPEINDIIMDVGISDYIEPTHNFAKTIGKNGKIYAFEPEPLCFQRAQEQFSQLPACQNIELIKLGLWDKKDKLFITENSGSSSVFYQTDDTTTKNICELTTLDDFVEENNINKIDFIKMDIEGAEPNALAGSVKTIEKFKPKLAICVYHHNPHLFELILFINSLDLGYEFYLDHHVLWFSETVLYAKTKGRPYSKRLQFKLKFLQQIFSVKNEGNHKVVRILGIKMKFKRRNKKG